MKKAYLFPGQGAQFSGMGQELYNQSEQAKNLFEQANDILGFRLTDTMFSGSDEDLKQTNITQPAIFVHSVVTALSADKGNFAPDMAAGHSLGEFSALTAAGALSFKDGLKLVAERAAAMQAACEQNPSTMAAVLGLADDDVQDICRQVAQQSGEVVVAANYNCPGQVVVSGSFAGIEKVTPLLTEAGAKRVLPLQVGGAFHSPLMEPARKRLAAAIAAVQLKEPVCPIYQNVDGKPYTDPEAIKANLTAQLTAPVRWTQTMMAMETAGAEKYIECGPGRVLQGLIKKINRKAEIAQL